MKLPNVAFRVDDTGEIPDGARVMTKDEVYNYQMQKVINYKPRSDMYMILKANDLVACGSFLSTVGVVSIFRNVFKVPFTKGSISTVIPVVGGSVIMAAIMHGVPRHKIILGNSSQSIRWRSGISNGIACGLISSMLSLSYCLSLRRRIDGSTYVQIFKSVNIKQLFYICLGVTFLQSCAGYFIADQEINCLEKATLFQHKHLTNTEEKESTSYD
ncbi:hypothetical protein LOTGIDRAFT_232963 [Lottia gigantea]|uniref:Uncharacterized protein n=1 Tax=Lottia gigantea TaxID=225164 RepID=V4BV64_LOTGI|nr:hypothetical protein LOTGIDRAFT_232963 [Lottia gigantea]ESO92889.1 hypothetical protein LOTGIDRAFT_232963 [Lottia gigantea]